MNSCSYINLTGVILVPVEYDDLCSIQCIHEEKVAATAELMPSEDTTQALAHIFKTLSDNSRIKILFALKHNELCVCDLAAVTGSSESSVSHHLRLLRADKLVKYRREGKVVYYSLADEHVEKIFQQGLEHVIE